MHVKTFLQDPIGLTYELVLDRFLQDSYKILYTGNLSKISFLYNLRRNLDLTRFLRSL